MSLRLSRSRRVEKSLFERAFLFVITRAICIHETPIAGLFLTNQRNYRVGFQKELRIPFSETGMLALIIEQRRKGIVLHRTVGEKLTSVTISFVRPMLRSD